VRRREERDRRNVEGRKEERGYTVVRTLFYDNVIMVINYNRYCPDGHEAYRDMPALPNKHLPMNYLKASCHALVCSNDVRQSVFL